MMKKKLYKKAPNLFFLFFYLLEPHSGISVTEEVFFLPLKLGQLAICTNIIIIRWGAVSN